MFWDRWLKRRIDNGSISALLDPARPLRPSLWPLVEQSPNEPVRILEVGAGPIASVGMCHPRRRVEITATDVLADRYDSILRRRGLTPPVRTIRADAERLSEQFGPESFDVVYAENCVDHMEQPLRAIRQMATVVRVGGCVVMEHGIDEGAHQHYVGLHQWNLTASDGTLLVWNRATSHDVGCLLAPWCEVRAEAREGTLVVEIRKLAPAP